MQADPRQGVFEFSVRPPEERKHFLLNEICVPRPVARLVRLQPDMKRLTVDGLRSVLPTLDELQPLVDHLLAGSRADPEKTWSGSGELGTAGARLVEAEGVTEAASALAASEYGHLSAVYAEMARAVAALQEGDPGTAAERFLAVASLEEARDDPRRASAYADAAHDLAREAGRPGLTSLTLRRRARYRRSMGLFDEAARDYSQALLFAEAEGDSRGAAEAIIGVGNVLEEQGRWDQAAERYRHALDTMEGADPPVPEQWHALLNLHVVLRAMGELEACAAPLEAAESVARTLADESATPFIENARGQHFMAIGDFEAAEAHLRRAVDTAGEARAEVTCRLNLAETLFALGRRLDAAEEARRAERGAIASSIPGKLPEVYRLLGRIAAAEGVSDAFVLFERALEIIRERQLPDIERAQTLQAYAEAESRVGDPGAADDLLRQADALYQSLGIGHRRDPWADRFDAGPETPRKETDHA